MSRRIPEGFTREELFPNHKPKPRARRTEIKEEKYDMALLAKELTDWACLTKSTIFGEFTRPRKITYKQVRAEALKNPDVQNAMDLAKDAIATNLKVLWLDNPASKDYSNTFIECYDDILAEHKSIVRAQVSKQIAESSTGRVVNITDSSGYLTKIDSE